jgi:hypothetical protein
MRKLHISKIKDVNPVLHRLHEQALKNRISDAEESRIIEQVRAGNVSEVDSLILAYEHLIFQLMLQYGAEPPFNTTCEEVKAALKRLVEIELGGHSKPVFLRLSAWTIRQSLLKIKGKSEQR